MKLYLAATAVVALAKHASAYKIVQDFDGNYCVMVVPYASSVWTGTATTVPAASTNADGVGPTVGPNGKNDPTGGILAAAVGAWGTNWVQDTAPNIYEAGGATLLTTQPATVPGTLAFCQMYSTSAPAHYCKGDGNYASWQKNTLSTTIDACCTSNHPTEYNACYKTSAGIAQAGDAKWYAKYDDGKCVRNCDTANLYVPGLNTLYSNPTTTVLGYECGGFTTWSGQTKHVNTDAGLGACCSSAFGSLQSNYCKFQSTVGSSSGASPYPGSSWDPTDAANWVASSWTTPAQYPGDLPSKWYADTSNSICKQDCIVGTSGLQCGGVVTAASTTLYDDASTCCDSMPWVTGCDTRSAVGEGNPTYLFWASQDGCREDCAASTGSNCVAAPSTAKLYPDATTCCKNANSWLNLKYCVSRANLNFDESLATSAGTNEWYVSYEDGVCRQDCFFNSASTPQCEFAQSGGLIFFSSAEACCKGTLASNDLEACIEGSEQGESITTVPTDRWYVSSGGSGGDQPCAKDCATGTACGGIVAKTGVRLYDTATDCCKQAYSWMDQSLCQKLSENADQPTNMWYVDYGADACVQDCTILSGTCKNPQGRPDDHSTPLFTTADACCKAKLNWIKSEICVVASESGIDPTDGDSPGAGAWRKNNAWSYCVLDCNEGDAIEVAAPILTVQPLSLTNGVTFVDETTTPTSVQRNTYPDQCDGVTSDSSATQYGASVENCCKSISWVQADTCKALSTGVKSEKFFQDPSDSTKCVVHQVASTSGIVPTPTIECGTVGTVSGVVTVPAGTVGVKCEAEIQPATKLYATLDACCKANVPWDADNCKYSSMGTTSPGTGDWYIDWSVEKCAQDCPETTTAGSSCGGIASKWQVLYSSTAACCKQISWISAAKCVFKQT